MYADADYYHEYYGSGMGLALAPVAGAVQVISGLFGGNSKDPGRLAANASAFSDAQAGDPSAVTYLKARSGRYGTIPITPPWHGDPDSPLGGWATSKAKDDAFTKYNAVAQSTPYVETTSVGGTVAPSMIPSASPKLSIPPLVIAGAAAVALYFLTQK